MKYIVFDIREQLKNSCIGSATITSNPLDCFRGNDHTNFLLLKTNDFSTESNFSARLSGENLVLGIGKTIKVERVPGNLLAFEPDSSFKALRTGYVKQVDISKIKSENLKKTSFFIATSKEGPKEWKRACFDTDGTLDFGVDPIKGVAVIESFEKLS